MLAAADRKRIHAITAVCNTASRVCDEHPLSHWAIHPTGKMLLVKPGAKQIKTAHASPPSAKTLYHKEIGSAHDNNAR